MAYDGECAGKSTARTHRQRRKQFIAPPRITNIFGISSGLVLLFGGIAAAQNQEDPREMLLQARQRVADTIRQLPRYVCTQTVDRIRYEPANPEYGTNGTRKVRSCDETIADAQRDVRKRHPSSADRLRLDVAVSHDRPGMENEMYSWAGENHFSERDLFEFVHDGAVSTGSFSSMLVSIFGNDAARFTYQGDSTLDGRPISEFGFRIPQEKSQYLYVFGETRQDHVAMAYDGTILVDSANSDLLRVSVRTEQLPAEKGVCELTQDLDYAHVRLNGGDFLLPSEARATIIHTDGTEAENRIQYSACHEFQGESTVRYEASQEAAGSAPEGDVAVPVLALPPGLPFKVTFTDPIDTATAAAGDPIRGRLKTAIRDRSEKVLVPEGARVTGRIMGIRRSFEASQTLVSDQRKGRLQATPSLVIHVRLETLDLGGGPQPFKAVFDTGVRRFVKQTGPFSVRVDIGSVDELHRRAEESDTGTFEFWDAHPDRVVKSGLESNWVTATP